MWKTAYRVAILTASDSGALGKRIDLSGPLIQKRVEACGGQVAEMVLLSDDKEGLSEQIKAWCDSEKIDLVLTTGGTGLALRDNMPEATLACAERQVPGIAEAMRAHSISITPRGMLSRGICATRKRTLILNLPGSPKAVGECLDVVLPVLEHGLDLLHEQGGECALTP